ncbi:hypothetical protein [Bacillus thuringiensis]|uniref:hypothetical protein n=1 Tax=Bacillus thuringiensis TaxID=1428 RepID=UPI000BFE14E3|nr:hypothetical protein [Bacillus thuringiensis]PGT89969.1 hypothetical protein COD17_09475 [Bacillus thuringiensis]
MAGLQDFIRRQVGKAPDYKRSRVEIEVMDDGIYRALSNGVTVLRRQETAFDIKQKLGAGEGKTGIEMLIPKIPFKYWLMTLDFYKEIYARYRTEASVFFYWNIKDVEIPQHLYRAHKDGILLDDKLLVYCPKQRNTGTLSSFGNDELLKWLEKNWQCIVETHSHHVMGAFFSNTDDRNEMKPRCYGVFAEINTADKFLTRFCLEGKHTFIEATDIFEIPKRYKEVTVVTEEKHFYDFGNAEAVEYNSKNDEKTQKVEVTGAWDNNATFPQSWLNMNLSGIDHSPIYDSEDEAVIQNTKHGLYPVEDAETTVSSVEIGDEEDMAGLEELEGLEEQSEAEKELEGLVGTYDENPVVISPNGAEKDLPLEVEPKTETDSEQKPWWHDKK